MMEKYIFVTAVIIFILAFILFVFDRVTMKKTMKALSDMLDRSIAGEFDQVCFNESMYSSLEAKLAKFLAQSALSSNNIKYERDKIKELIADISHQTKTPIANIVLYAQLIGENALPQDCMRQIELLVNQSEKLNFLINSLVNLSRLETGIIAVTPKRDNINSLLNSVKENILPKARAKNITVIFPKTDDEAEFDIKWTSEALYNIADNAVKYSPDGGRIEMKVTSYEMFCRIDITDNGIGIAKEELNKVFGRFYRSEQVRDRDGVGIGLFLAREIVSAQKGYIKVASEIGRGCRFSIFLPK